MPQIQVKIGSRDYPVYCEDGQEQKLQEIVSLVNQELSEISSASTTIPESRQIVLTCLLLANKVLELKNQQTIPDTSSLPPSDDKVAEKELFEKWSAQYEPVINQMIEKISTLAKMRH